MSRRNDSRPATSGRIEGLVGVLLWTSSERFDAMDRFYREVLGLSPRSRRPGFVNFDWGATRLTVAVHDMVEGSARDPLRIMVNLGVDDIHDAHARLHEQGVEFVRQPERESWGGWVATLYDPDGNIVQLLQLRPG